MSLAIACERVSRVLLSDGWHVVALTERGESSFQIDSYEFMDGEHMALGGGSESLIPARGFSFVEKPDEDEIEVKGNPDDLICGPLHTILAVRCRSIKKAAEVKARRARERQQAAGAGR